MIDTLDKKEILPPIPTTYMPEDWRQRGAKKFSCSVNKIERVVYTPTAKTEIKIYEFMLGLAETGKVEYENKKIELTERINALS